MITILTTKDGVSRYTIFTMARLDSSGSISPISGTPRKCEKITLPEDELTQLEQSAKKDR